MIVSRDWSWFRSLRWGRNQPGAVLWWACSPIGQYVIVDEWKFQQLDPPEVVANIRAHDFALRMKEPARYCAAEPKLWEIDNPHSPTLAEMFARAGLPLFMSSGDRVQGWNTLSALLKQTTTDPRIDGDLPRPALVIAESCAQLRRMIPLLREGQGAGANAKEDIDTKTDAAMVEALRIGAMSRPSKTALAEKRPEVGMMGHALERARRESTDSSSTSTLI